MVTSRPPSDCFASFGARVVAAGMVKGKPGRIRLTVNLMPVKHEDGAPKILLRDWPIEIERLLRSSENALELWASAPVEDSHDGKISRPRFGGACIPLPAHGIPPQAEKEQGAVNDFWQELIPPDGEETVWSALVDVLDVESEPPAPYLKDGRPQIAPTGRADAALLHLLDRAERVIHTLAAEGLSRPIAAASDLVERGAAAIKADAEPSQENYKALLEEDRRRAKAAFELVLGPRVEQEAKVFNARKSYLTSKLAEETKAALIEASLKTAGTAPREQFFDPLSRESLCRNIRALHLAAVWPDPENKIPSLDGRPLAEGGAEVKEVGLQARNLLFALRSYPTLARLFRLVVDVEVDATVVLKAAQSARPFAGDAEKEEFRFLFLGAGTDKKRVATLARLETRPGDIVDLWPATREELDLRYAGLSTSSVRASGAATSLGGIIDLSVRQMTGEGAAQTVNPRFALVTIDPALAAETRIRAANRAEDLARSLQATGEGETAPENARRHETNALTRGFTLIDRWRASAVAAEIAGADAPWNDGALPILDADDLTIGYRLDVSYRESTGQHGAWRSLNEREIRFFHPSDNLDDPATDRTVPWFEALGLQSETERRRELDASVLVPGVRRRGLDPSGEMLHVEEALTTWEGDPLGVGCYPSKVPVVAGADLAVTRTFRLPDEADEHAHKPWPLRYGWAYSFALRPVWYGGVSLTLDQARSRYQSQHVRDMALPSSEAGRVSPFRRFLRLERVLKPQVLLPQGIALMPDLLAKQSATVVTLRTAQGEPSRSLPQDTWRIILPAEIGLEEASRHGRFDAGDHKQRLPDGDFGLVDFDAEWGGFPLAVEQTTAEGQPSEKRAEIRKARLVTQGSLGQERSRRAPPEMQGELMFRIRNAADPAARVKAMAEATKGIYYADPAAEFMVMALRRAGTRTGTGYFRGAPVVVPLRKSSDLLPVAVHFVAAADLKRAAGKETRQEHFRSDAARKDGYIDVAVGDETNPTSGKGKRHPARLVTFELAPGDAVELDVWSIPSEKALARIFDLPEAIAVEAMMLARRGLKANEHPGHAALRKALDALLPQHSFRTWNAPNPLLPDTAQTRWSSHGDVEVQAWMIQIVASYLHQFLKYRPIPEIASLETIKASHATDKPRAPEWKKNEVIKAYRVAATDMARTSALDQLRKNQPPPIAQPGDTGIALAGKALFDRDTSRQLEVLARLVTSPGIGFDDPKRGRTPEERLAGEWNLQDASASGDVSSKPNRKEIANIHNARANDHNKLSLTRLLYGFEVAPNGVVTLPKSEVCILQVDAIGALDPDYPPLNHTLEQVDLAEEQLRALKTSEKLDQKNRTISFEPFNDHLARRLELSLRSTTRYDSHFLRVVATQATGHAPETHYVPQAAGMLSARSNDKEQQEVWVPATRRPDKPIVHAVSPVFLTEEVNPTVRDEGWVARRVSTILRVYLDRPWFSSGEGERLGIVLWPPDIESLDQAALAAGIVRKQKGALHDRDMDLWENFADSDLGEAGRFVTRMGVDPIRTNPILERPDATRGRPGGPSPIGPFLTLLAFPDFAPDGPTTVDPQVPKLVSSVPMPASSEDDEPNKNEDDEQGPKKPPPLKRGSETLLVSLVTFVPRFDVEREKWFVDLRLNLGPYAEPFVRLGLVRYQKHALPFLEASAPVVTWAQTPSQRTVEVRSAAIYLRTADGKTKQHIEYKVVVHGPEDTLASGDVGDRPGEMQFTIRRFGRTAASLPFDYVPRDAVDEADCERIVLRGLIDTSAGTPIKCGWYARFVLPKLGKDDGRYRLTLEETERFPSTADELALPNSRPTMTQSGPRFLFEQILPAEPWSHPRPPKTMKPPPQRRRNARKRNKRRQRLPNNRASS
ncbi:hypothetical protein [Bosea sp. FBZP-16]|uniref:hypothetical protein n=1 Tax=Bosea sp. FBZP-16 TaxID=2065382 RepID=UPI000C30FD0E|nr:hypothetical protein [Bosea sp. FBZP-16]